MEHAVYPNRCCHLTLFNIISKDCRRSTNQKAKYEISHEFLFSSSPVLQLQHSKSPILLFRKGKIH